MKKKHRESKMENKKGYSTETAEYLATVRKTLDKADMLTRAKNTVEVDMMTVCPEQGIDEAGAVTAMLGSEIFSLMNEPGFIEAVTMLYSRIDELDEWDRVMTVQLYTDYMHIKNISPEQNEENLNARNRAWSCWLKAKEQKDFRLFESALEALVESEKKRVCSWEPMSAHEKEMSAYDRMLNEYERGITRSALDRLFGECRTRITTLLRRIRDEGRHIRTDFLTRRVSAEQQKRLSGYLLRLMGLNMSAGALAESEHPFTTGLGRNDVRITTHYYEDNFLSNFYTILHEGGHALFEQLQPGENFEHHISGRKTMGMHESVSRFYENMIGRSRSFIYSVYPVLCDIFPQVFFDVTAQELYEAVNYVQPSLIRVDADELTYTLHIIIRYEIEIMLMDGEIGVHDIPRIWKEKYEQYLGVTPGDDSEGALQDSHWTSSFGYFPTYALGNFYNAMYAQKMRESIDIDSAIAEGDLSAVNAWMKEHIFAKADRLDAEDWITDITGEELTAEYFLSYLEKKYGEIYDISDSEEKNRHFDEYARRMIKIRQLSAPQIDNINSADDYRIMLTENFRQIGDLACENRDMITKDIEPILRSHDLLSAREISQIDRLKSDLLDAMTHKNIDINITNMLSDRLMRDAEKKCDDDYLIRCLDEQIIIAVALSVQMHWIHTAPEITDRIMKAGLTAFEHITSYLDKDKFSRLSDESKELILIDSRYGDGLFILARPLTADERKYRFDKIRKSIALQDDPFYTRELPGYEWKYHIYRALQYISSFDFFGNYAGFDDDELQSTADFGEQLEALWLSDREYYEKLDPFGYIHAHTLRNQMHAGRITRKLYCEELYKLYLRRNSGDYSVDGIAHNIEIPAEYIMSLDIDNLTEQQKAIAEQMYRSAMAYIFSMPKSMTFYELLDCYTPLLLSFIELPGGMTFEEMGLQSFAAFHPQTYIHSIMVANITQCIASHLMKKQPGLFKGVCGCPDAESVPAYSERIREYAYHAALCHDFGKLIIIETVSTYGRNIFDSEFDIIKQHPALGAMMLEKHASTRMYADVARGHHKWYNEEKGYPDDFRTADSPVKVIIDITACADCMDAATDTVGRSYNSGKTLDEYIAEVRSAGGTRYAPYLYDLLTSPEVYSDISYLLSNGRQQAYRDTYLMLKNVRNRERGSEYSSPDNWTPAG